jgi:hypothetical protein
MAQTGTAPLKSIGPALLGTTLSLSSMLADTTDLGQKSEERLKFGVGAAPRDTSTIDVLLQAMASAPPTSGITMLPPAYHSTYAPVLAVSLR